MAQVGASAGCSRRFLPIWKKWVAVKRGGARYGRLRASIEKRERGRIAPARGARLEKKTELQKALRALTPVPAISRMGQLIL